MGAVNFRLAANVLILEYASGRSRLTRTSLFVNNKTGYRVFYEEQLGKKQLENEIRKMVSVK